jgi:hypothetical protein
LPQVQPSLHLARLLSACGSPVLESFLPSYIGKRIFKAKVNLAIGQSVGCPVNRTVKELKLNLGQSVIVFFSASFTFCEI